MFAELGGFPRRLEGSMLWCRREEETTPSFLDEAIDLYLDLDEHHGRLIKQGIADAMQVVSYRTKALDVHSMNKFGNSRYQQSLDRM
jgi:hypothetical protein